MTIAAVSHDYSATGRITWLAEYFIASKSKKKKLDRSYDDRTMKGLRLKCKIWNIDDLRQNEEKSD
jgi:hypothetical protein